MREGLAANNIDWLAGIINGTGNYILTEMGNRQRLFSDVLRESQELGYAVSGSELLLLSGKSLTGMRVVRIDHPGEYPHRY